jgi:cobaltochelatase CobT
VNPGQTTAAVYRALATVPGHPPAADPGAGDAAGWQMLLSEAPRQPPSPQTLARWRGRVDALALRTRFSDARRYRRALPGGAAAQMLFSLLEQARVDALGARAYAGVRANLEALLQERWIRARPEGVVRPVRAAWVETLALLARVPMGAPLPPAARAALADSWRNWVSAEEAAELAALAGLLDDQEAFARQALRVIAAALGPAALRPDETDEADEPPDARERQRTPQDSPAARPDETNAAAHVASGDPMAASELQTSAPRPAAAGPQAVLGAYRVYTQAFDETVMAAELCDAHTLAQHRRTLDERFARQLGGIRRWAHRLQRRLLSLQRRSWQYDLEEGLLDAARLSRVVTRPLEPLAYKQESESAFPDTVVTLLLDNSGSMRGVPIATAALCAEVLGRVLERCGVGSEVLGFTTRGWGGGRARAQWIAAGRPPHPGRLAELRHIIYKDAKEPWRRARVRLGLMLEDGVLRENIDGEALLWAYGRLMRRVEPRRILLVISDGAPMDDATLAANDAGYLDRHLRAVIDWIERDAQVELAAVGIGHDVTQYYRRAVTLPGPDELGEAIVTELVDLLEPPRRRSGGRR